MKTITELELELKFEKEKVELFKNLFIDTREKLKAREEYIEECEECLDDLNGLTNRLTALINKRGGF